ncbi:hypothetical protein D9753_12445 [Streptomyces dangxiongensis]|uniref:Peptidoglycan binding domain-containing protein n=1 Tax=Streptomyces dangxiongensis TaxID=1442032 RepID=A0A3G2JBQ3_9ACTN|nr:hypothetical protein [Streptomyces dangxiongensis]AYN39594.1 hypothetical protein D9753_12445 [Streptomyces dangxiongensis]
MSRETDTPSSGPSGRGGAAYPSGTPPYGTPLASDDATGAGRSGTRPEEKKTETTLTTRIRINIPGSRPIPPVVMRKPVGDAESAGEEQPAAEPVPAAERAPAGPAEAPADPAAPGDDKPSDWFAPRKSSPGKGAPGGGGTNGAGMPGGSAATPATPGVPGARTGGPGASGAAGSTGARAGGGRPGGVVGSMSVPGARSGGTNGKGLPGGATGGPVAPGHGGGTGSFDVTEALTGGQPGGGPRPRPSGPSGPSGPGEPRRDALPYFSENGTQDGYGGGTAGTGGQDGLGAGTPGTGGASGRDGYAGAGAAGAAGQGGFGAGTAGAAGRDGFGGTPGAGGAGGPGGPSGFSGPGGHGGPGGPQGPAGPTSGPATGDGPLVPPAGEPFDAPGGPAGYGTPGGQGTPPARSALAGPAGPTGPGGPGGPRATPGGGPAGRGPGGLSDDTAILTPQKPAPEPGTPGYRSPAADNVSGHTVTSGIPVVPSTGKSPFGTHTDGAPAAPAAPRPEPAPAPKAAARPKKKGRSKLVLLAVGVVVVAGGAYGAGLLMNHTDVPKGTTVLGVDIGGGTRDEAVKKLDDAFGSRVNKPLKLAVGGRTVTLTPENAGLQFDYQATVSEAAKSDYNPVHVVGSLFGQKRVVQPAMPVDEEKLQAALQQAGGGSGSVTDGTIRFDHGRAVAVYGKPGKAIDAARSTQAAEQAYRTLVETGTASSVGVPTTTKEPTVSNAEVDRMMKDFAKPAMSGNVTVQTDAAHVVPMSPQNSLWKFLRVTAVDGKLVDKPDLAALKQLYGQAFDGVLITRGNGKKTAVTPEDVYAALRQALMSKSNRVAVIDTNPS